MRFIIKDNIFYLKKLTPVKIHYVWFGYNLYYGKYNLSFSIYSNKNINNFNFIKLHNPINFINTPNINPYVWTDINIEINVKCKEDLLCFIFDDFEDIIELEFKNINIRQIIPQIHFVSFYTNGPPHDGCLNIEDSYIKYKKYISEYVDTYKFYSYSELNNNPDTKIYVKSFDSQANHNIGTNKCGYLRWKPYIILKELEKLNDNDILYYRDCNINKYPNILIGIEKTKNICEYILNEIKCDIFVPIEHPSIRVKHHCKKKIYETIDNYEDYYLDNFLLNASVIICKKTPMILSILKEWLNYCLNDELIDVDTFNEIQHIEFRWNTQEQAILNVLLYKYKKNKLLPENFPIFCFSDRKLDFNNLIKIL